MIHDNLEDELSHFGVKGMRWGHRKMEFNSDKVQKSRAMVDASKGGVDATKTLVGHMYNRKKGKYRRDASSYSDDELKTLINRMNMEQQFSNLSSSYTTRGQDRITTILDIAGATLAIGSSAASIALAYKALKS